MESGDQHICHKEIAPDAPSLFQKDGLVFQVYHVGWIICGFFTLIATVVSFWLVNKHLQWYTNKREQRYIVRILFMVPIYAIISFASFLFWNNAVVLLLIRDAYEAIVLTAFFYLLLMYLSPNPEVQKAIFAKAGLSKEADRQAELKGEKLQTWIWPLGYVRWKPADGFYFLQLMKWGVLQYCVLRPLTTLAAVILDYMGLYCEESWGFGWGHVYVIVVISLSVTVSMYCLIQLYVVVSTELAPHKPLLKFFAIKAVVFLTFWQATALSGLSMLGVIQDSAYMTAADINVGIRALLETFEMMIFAFMHVKAFTYKPYIPAPIQESDDTPLMQTSRLRALGHAFDFRETFREIWVGCVYMYDKIRGRPPAVDHGARRHAMYEEAFGRARPSHMPPRRESHNQKVRAAENKSPQPTLPDVEVEVQRRVVVDVEGERQWLGIGEEYGYGWGLTRKEQSDSLGVQIDRELEKRGYSSLLRPEDTLPGTTHPKQKSWWQRLYHRFSHSSVDQSRTLTPASAFHAKRQSYRDIDLDEPPPPSTIRGRRDRIQSWVRDVSEQTYIDRSLDAAAPRSRLIEHRSPQQSQPNQRSLPPTRPVAEIYHRPLQTSPPPPLPSMPRNAPIVRSDSLLARVFTYENVPSAHGHISDAGTSRPSAAHGSTPSTPATPLARVVVKDPYNITIERKQGLPMGIYTTDLPNEPPVPNLPAPTPAPYRARIIEDAPLTQSPPPMDLPEDRDNKTDTIRSHRRESAFHDPDPDVASPSSPEPAMPPHTLNNEPIQPPLSIPVRRLESPTVDSSGYRAEYQRGYARVGVHSSPPGSVPDLPYPPSPPLASSPLLQPPPRRLSMNEGLSRPPSMRKYHPKRLTIPAPLAPPTEPPPQVYPSYPNSILSPTTTMGSAPVISTTAKPS
ncbi:hypothetical protein AX16_003989 [Volvariella volvacea WC 439]|nr:hypothetical protein AX16_003989 [Volvariella volvacea WC 439]